MRKSRAPSQRKKPIDVHNPPASTHNFVSSDIIKGSNLKRPRLDSHSSHGPIHEKSVLLESLTSDPTARNMKHLLQKLNNMQLRAVLLPPKSPILVIAGPGQHVKFFLRTRWIMIRLGKDTCNHTSNRVSFGSEPGHDDVVMVSELVILIRAESWGWHLPTKLLEKWKSVWRSC